MSTEQRPPSDGTIRESQLDSVKSIFGERIGEFIKLSEAFGAMRDKMMMRYKTIKYAFLIFSTVLVILNLLSFAPLERHIADYDKYAWLASLTSAIIAAIMASLTAFYAEFRLIEQADFFRRGRDAYTDAERSFRNRWQEEVAQCDDGLVCISSANAILKDLIATDKKLRTEFDDVDVFSFKR